MDTRSTTTAGDPALLQELLLDELRDLLHAEGQLLKALPKMAKAAQSDVLRRAFENHLAETEEQVTRLKESFSLLGAPAKAKPCKGMAGLVAEGEEIMAEGEEQDDAFADLALIAAAQKVEHYEISGYGTSRTLAEQIGQPDVALLLSKSLAEEEVADNLLTQIAREFMSQPRNGTSKAAAVRSTPRKKK
jgi:Mn-containing catalase